MADNPRIEELRRRVQKDPASIAFAQLAEEHRRAGNFEEAVAVATAGLQQHSAYLSARVTLGRALLELGRLDEAAAEFEFVVQAAPDNLTAVRQLADIHQRRRQLANDAKSRPSDHKEAAAPPQVGAQPYSAAPRPVVAAPAPYAMAPPTQAVAPQPSPAAPAQAGPLKEHSSRQDDPIIEELEAWLAVLASERNARQRHADESSGPRIR